MYIILAPIQVREDARDAFIRETVEDARRSVAEEPGCVRFDVIQDAGDRNRVWVYEVYRDEAAFKAHLQQPYVVRWRKVVQEWRMEGPKGAAPGSVNIWPGDDEWK